MHLHLPDRADHVGIVLDHRKNHPIRVARNSNGECSHTAAFAKTPNSARSVLFRGDIVAEQSVLISNVEFAIGDDWMRPRR